MEGVGKTEPFKVEYCPRLINAIDTRTGEVLHGSRVRESCYSGQDDRSDATRNERPELGTQQAEAEETQQRQ